MKKVFVIQFFIQLILSMEKAIKHRTQKQRELVISFLIHPIHSAGRTWGTDRLGEGSWLPLGSPENAVEDMCHLSERSELWHMFSVLSILRQA